MILPVRTGHLPDISSPFGTSVYSSGIPQISKVMGVSVEVTTLGLSLYSIGLGNTTCFPFHPFEKDFRNIILGLGPAIGALISETRGRKAVYLITLPTYLFFILGSGLSSNITSFLVCRTLSAIAGAPAVAMGAGTVAEVWDMEKGRGIAAVVVMETWFAGPGLGPLVGGYTMETRNDWKWLMWVLLLISGPQIILILVSSETSKKEILRRRAKLQGLPGPPKPQPLVALKTFLVITILRPLRMLVTEPIVEFISLYHAFAYGLLFAFFSSYPYIFGSIYDFNEGQVGLAFLGIFIGTLLAVATFGIVDKTLYQTAKKNASPGTLPPPEKRLYTSMIGSFGIPVGLFWLA
jgi:MFS family permease